MSDWTMLSYIGPDRTSLGFVEADRVMTSDEFIAENGWTPDGDAQSVRIDGDGWIVFVDVGENYGASVQGGNRAPTLAQIDVMCDGLLGIDAVGIYGPQKVMLRGEGTVNSLECVGREPEFPSVYIESVVSVRDFMGDVNLSQMHGSLACKRVVRKGQPGCIRSLEDCQNGKVVGADITHLSPQHLSAHAVHLTAFSPDVETLYDIACTDDRLSWRRKDRTTPKTVYHQPCADDMPAWLRQMQRIETERTALESAHWFLALHDALRRAVVPASTRAAVQWCYVLLEHQTIKGNGDWRLRLESLGRWLHRCVGYGHRPSRPLVTWAAMSLAVAVWSVLMVEPKTDDSPSSAATPAREPPDEHLGEWLLTLGGRFFEALTAPIRAVLRLGADPPELLASPTLNVVAYLLVGVPFVFFVVALRQFFRSPLSGQPAEPA